VDCALAGGSPYALGLIDLNMPDVDGRELGRRLRANPSIDAMRLVLLTPAGARSDATEDAATFDGSLTKPVRYARLHEEVRAVTLGERPAPRRRTPSDRPGAAATPDDVSPCVLVVEDTEVNQVVAALMLSKSGFRSQVAANGRLALEALSAATFAAALMDCQMPELDGYETTREIRRREQGSRRMPIIAMTANSMEGERERCLAAGMDDYVTKPLRLRTLQDALGRWITQPPPEATGEPLLDEAVLTQIENLDPDVLSSILPLYSVQAAGNISELGGAVDRGELVSLARTAHKLKGSSGAIGAREVARLAGALETRARAGDLAGANQLVGELRGRLDQTLVAFGTRAARSADQAANRS
jgi:CheY-like chemotaxis protein/HPt (histidine-containing phosphotransfer) domain-containing protein